MVEVNVSGIAGEAEKVVESVMKVEPMIAGIAGMFVPAVAVVQPWIVMLAPSLEKALHSLSENNGGDAVSALFELMQHVMKGQPNSPTLSEPDTSMQNSG